MAFKTDIEIAQETTMQPITEVAKTAKSTWSSTASTRLRWTTTF